MKDDPLAKYLGGFMIHFLPADTERWPKIGALLYGSEQIKEARREALEEALGAVHAEMLAAPIEVQLAGFHRSALAIRALLGTEQT